jgi:membrane-bound lytic murein transglycosylase C
MPRTRFPLLLAAAVVAASSGCQTTDRALNTAEKAVTAPTIKTVVGLATSKSPEAVIRKRLEGYLRNPVRLIKDLRQAQRDYEALKNALTGKVSKTWGKKEVRLPDRTRYVKYTQNYRSRAIVDFDKGEILVETLDAKDPRGSLKNAIVTTLLTPDDPRAVDLFSDKGVKLTSEKDPYLLGLVHDQNGKPVRTPADAEQFADHLIANQSSTRAVAQDGGSKTVHVVAIGMVPNHANKQAEKYRPQVTKFAEQYKVSPNLIFAIIRTESNFNPFAVSGAPAYGLMQLVPTSGGREAYKRAKGSDATPSREYLFNADNNIELGTALLNVLHYKQFEDVDNAVSREYCVISAYNTGLKNVLRTFSKDVVTAANQINSLEPPAVYDKLRQNLPYQETREYLVKVTGFRKQFVSATETKPQADGANRMEPRL